jgi:hypothetical protein
VSGGFHATAVCASGTLPVEGRACKPAGGDYDFCTTDGVYHDKPKELDLVLIITLVASGSFLLLCALSVVL